MAGYNTETLEQKFPETEWRSKYAEFCSLIEILSDSVIPEDYNPSDDLNAALDHLSDTGREIFERLVRKESVPAKSARLMCALTIGHKELFVDIGALDIESIVAAIDSEIHSKRLRYPFIFGRDFYDAYAKKFDDERESLTLNETLQLLDDLPTGVFQYGPFVTGPYGLLRSLSSRQISATRRVPAYHCSTASCPHLHHTHLDTARNAPVNKERAKLAAILEKEPGDSSAWWEFAANVAGAIDAYFDDKGGGPLAVLLSDCLSIGELRAVLSRVLDRTEGRLREALEPRVKIADAEAFANTINRAQILQLLLVAREDDVGIALDHLVAASEIEIPSGEIRRPVTSSERRSGAFDLRPELGEYGWRFVSSDPGVSLLRLRYVLRALFDLENESDLRELQWQLRRIESRDVDEQFEQYFRATSPRDAVRHLVLTRRTHVETVCEELGIVNFLSLNDEQTIDSILWKLGFTLVDSEDTHREFWFLFEGLAATAQLATPSSVSAFKAMAGPFFACLEGVLMDALAFTSWALLTDHTQTSGGFAYDDRADRAAGLKSLDSAAEQSDQFANRSPGYSTQEVGLQDLIMGFGLLADVLEDYSANASDWKRPDDQYPKFSGRTRIKQFQFVHIAPFLDVSHQSQQRIVIALREVTASLLKARVCEVRNDHLHYRRSMPDINLIEEALESIRMTVTRLEYRGFARVLFHRSDTLRDSNGQTKIEFRGPRGATHTFLRPTSLDWMGLPTLQQGQYLLRAASFGDTTEVLRFRPLKVSEFTEMWAGYPAPRQKGRPTAGSLDDAQPRARTASEE